MYICFYIYNCFYTDNKNNLTLPIKPVAPCQSATTVLLHTHQNATSLFAFM